MIAQIQADLIRVDSMRDQIQALRKKVSKAERKAEDLETTADNQRKNLAGSMAAIKKYK